MGKKRKWTDEQLVTAVKDNFSVYGVLSQIGLKLCGGSHANVKLRIRQLGLDTSHFTGQGWCKGDKHKEFIKKISYSLSEILVKDSTYQSTHNIKRKVFQAGLLEQKCSKCGLGKEWNGEKLSLQLDHKDGDRSNNRIENLRILCPNCHSQTENYAGKAKRKAKVAELADAPEGD